MMIEIQFLIQINSEFIVCDWFNFVVHENVTSRAGACLFRSDLVSDIVFIQIYFSNLSLIYKL